MRKVHGVTRKETSKKVKKNTIKLLHHINPIANTPTTTLIGVHCLFIKCVVGSREKQTAPAGSVRLCGGAGDNISTPWVNSWECRLVSRGNPGVCRSIPTTNDVLIRTRSWLIDPPLCELILQNFHYNARRSLASWKGKILNSRFCFIKLSKIKANDRWQYANDQTTILRTVMLL